MRRLRPLSALGAVLAPGSPLTLPALAAVAAVLALAAPAPAAARGTGSVAGSVRDAFTGRPVTGVEVRLVPRHDPEHVLASAVSGAGGRYRLAGVEPGAYHVYAASSAGYVGELSDGTPCYSGLWFRERFGGYLCDHRVVDPPVIEVAAGRTVFLRFALDLGGVIAGRVTAAASGEPVAGASVYVSDPRGTLVDFAVTGVDGRYRVRGLPAGGYRVKTYNQVGLADEIYDGIHCGSYCDSRRGTPVAMALRREVTIDFALERLGAVAGRITDAASGVALGGIEVTAWHNEPFESFSSHTGADGRYLVGGLPTGEYRVRTGNDGGWVDEVYDDVPCFGDACHSAEGTPVAVGIDRVTEGVDFALDFGGSISGSVVSEATGAPLGGVVVRVSSADRVELYALRTGADGRFRVFGLPAGSYLLHTTGAREHGVADEVYDGEPCGLDETSCDLGLATPVPVALGEEAAGIDFTLEPLGTIAGTVTEEATGAPIPGVALLIYDLRGGLQSAQTDAAGRYRSPPLPRGEFAVVTEGQFGRPEFIDEVYDDVRCFARGCDPLADGTPVPVASGATTGGVDFALRLGAVIEGRVTRESDGRPDRFATVSVFDSRGRGVRGAHVDEDGFYRAPGLVDGDYYVTTSAGSFGLVDELYDRNQCLHGTALGCAPTEGTPVHVAIGAPPPTVDFALASGFRPGVPCRPSPTRICLGGGRFRVGVRRFTLDEPGLARARPISESAGAFTFFADDNLEAVVRVVDACAGFDRFWVLAASLSDLGTEAGVLDTVTGEARLYVNLDFWPTLDAAAFATCGATAAGEPAAARVLAHAGGERVVAGEGLGGELDAVGPDAGDSAGVIDPAGPNDPAPVSAAAPASAPGVCLPGPSTLCLLDGRFAVEVEWADGAGGGGAAAAVPLGDRSGYLWFHRPGSPEVAVKALDACATQRPGFWFFAGGLTDSSVVLTVTDTVSGESQQYLNPLGRPFSPIRDLGRFDACP